jgi:hypothetical protein
MKTCSTCRFLKSEVYPTMVGMEAGCLMFSTVFEDLEGSGLYDKHGCIIDDKYIEYPAIVGEDSGLMIPHPEKFGCMVHEDKEE